MITRWVSTRTESMSRSDQVIVGQSLCFDIDCLFIDFAVTVVVFVVTGLFCIGVNVGVSVVAVGTSLDGQVVVQIIVEVVVDVVSVLPD